MDEEFKRYAAARWSRLFSTAVLLCGDRHTAEDLVQQTLEKAYTAWARVSRADEPDAYVRRILLNEHARSRRKVRREALTVRVPEPRDSPADTTDWDGVRTALLAALAQLPLRQRQTVVLRYWEDLSESQTAVALGCSTGTVRSQASRGIAKLRRIPALTGLISTGDTHERQG